MVDDIRANISSWFFFNFGIKQCANKETSEMEQKNLECFSSRRKQNEEICRTVIIFVYCYWWRNRALFSLSLNSWLSELIQSENKIDLFRVKQ